MRTKVTLALLFLNVALYFFIFYVLPHLANGPGEKEPSRLVLPSGATDIREMEITVGADTSRLVRRGEQWCIEAPIEWPANPIAVEHILTELQSLKHETFFTVASLEQNNLSLAEYGLEQPLMSVTLTTAPGASGEAPRKYTLRVGNTTKVENRLYVLSTDGTLIHVVPRSLGDALSIPLEELRSSALFTIPDFEVRNFTIQPSAAASTRTRIRRDENRWAMENPVQTRANTSAVKATLSQLSGLKVNTFIATPLPPELNPGTATSLRITLEGNNRSETLLLGAPVPRDDGQVSRNFYAQFEWKIDGERKSAIFTVALPQTLFDSLRTAQERLRETRILDVNTAALTGLTLRAPGQPDLRLQRLEATSPGESQRWQLVRRLGNEAPDTMPADPAAVKQLLERLALLNANRFVTDAPGSADVEAWGFNRPERTLVLQSEETPLTNTSATTRRLPGLAAGEAGQAITLELGVAAESRTKAYARLDTASYIYEVDSEILEQTNPDPRLWRDRRLQDLPAGARIASISITDLKSGEVITQCNFSPSTTDNQREDLPPDTLPEEQRQAWSSLAASMRSLRARSFVADHYESSFVQPSGEQSWPYRLTIEVTLQASAGEQTSTRTIDFSERLGGTRQLAASKELKAVFELEQTAVDALWTILNTPPKINPLSLLAPQPQAAPDSLLNSSLSEQLRLTPLKKTETSPTVVPPPPALAPADGPAPSVTPEPRPEAATAPANADTPKR